MLLLRYTLYDSVFLSKEALGKKKITNYRVWKQNEALGLTKSYRQQVGDLHHEREITSLSEPQFPQLWKSLEGQKASMNKKRYTKQLLPWVCWKTLIVLFVYFWQFTLPAVSWFWSYMHVLITLQTNAFCRPGSVSWLIDN